MTGEAAVHLQDQANWASFPAPLQRGDTRGIVRRSLPLPPSPSPSEGPQRSSQGSTTRTPPQLLPRCGIVPFRFSSFCRVPHCGEEVSTGNMELHALFFNRPGEESCASLLPPSLFPFLNSSPRPGILLPEVLTPPSPSPPQPKS